MQYIEYYDINLNDANAVDDYRIEVKERENWFLPCKGYIECHFKLTQPDGTAWAGAQNVALQNNAVGLFSRWELKFDDEIVEFVDDADIQNTVKSLVYFSDGYSDSIEKNQFWFPDTVNNTVTPANTIFINPVAFDSLTSLETVNYGQRKRQQLLNNSSMVVVQIPLMNVFDLFKSMKHVTKGIKLSLRLSRNSNDRVIFAANPSIVYISKVALWIPRIKPNVSVLSTLEAKLNSTKTYYTHYVDTQIFKSNLITDVADNKLFQIKIKRKRPVKCFVVFQNSYRVTGDQTFCKRVFDNISLLKLRVVLNATTQYPEREYSTRFSANNNDYARVYNEFLRCSLKDHNIDEGSIVTFENFKSLYPIFAIDMSEQAEYNVNPESALLDVYFTTLAHPTDYYMYVLVESERKLEMVGSNGMMKYLKTL
jgi:hypothetical protein